MPIPSPKERPDLYDEGYDGRPEGSVKPGEEDYWNSLLPPEMQSLLKKNPAPAPDQRPSAEGEEKPA